jgi:hypothetical protein
MVTTEENFDFSKRVRAILKHRRKIALEHLKDELATTLNIICEDYEDHYFLPNDNYSFEKPVAGFTPEQLNTIIDKYYDIGIDQWIESGADGMLDELIIRFMRFREMSRSGLKQRFPCTFQKWKPQDEEDLRTIWARTDQNNVNWEDLEEMFGRPRNAIKIRLEKMGFTLSEPATKRF